MELSKYLDMQREAERLQREADKIEGALGQERKNMEERFGCKTTKEAKKLLEKMEYDFAELERSYENTLAEFQSKYFKPEGNF